MGKNDQGEKYKHTVSFLSVFAVTLVKINHKRAPQKITIDKYTIVLTLLQHGSI